MYWFSSHLVKVSTHLTYEQYHQTYFGFWTPVGSDWALRVTSKNEGHLLKEKEEIWLSLSLVCVQSVFDESLRLVDAALGDDSWLLGPASLPSHVGDLVQGLDAADDVPEDPGELGVHVGQDYAELGGDLKNK